jgi:hypothetical protein
LLPPNREARPGVVIKTVILFGVEYGSAASEEDREEALRLLYWNADRVGPRQEVEQDQFLSDHGFDICLPKRHTES